MMITHLKMTNWKNFKTVDVDLGKRVFIVGPNASGKSNLLDALRFLRDLAMPSGGGLQQAIGDRGGVSAIRCLAARQPSHIEIAVKLGENSSDENPWTYELGIEQERRGNRRPRILFERVSRGVKRLLERPDADDDDDEERKYQTALEQTTFNKDFRDIAKFLGKIEYFHLVPQMLKYPQAFSGPDLPGDPFGRGFLENLANVTTKKRDASLRKIEGMLKIAVPQLSSLEYVEDNGKPHLRAMYRHWRPDAGIQHETQFSDGTLRLIGLAWSMLEGSGPLLLEEPELSLNNGIVEKIPGLLHHMRKTKDRQSFISTHSEALLSDSGIGLEEILLLTPRQEGTGVLPCAAIKDAVTLLKAGFSPAEIVFPQAKPESVENLELQF
jgi:predicted ATPase